MKVKERSFIEITKRFLEPIKKSKIVFLKSSIVLFQWAINWIIHVLFLERIIFYLELLDKQWFQNVLLIYFIYIFSFNIYIF